MGRELKRVPLDFDWPDTPRCECGQKTRWVCGNTKTFALRCWRCGEISRMQRKEGYVEWVKIDFSQFPGDKCIVLLEE
jgi:hypothetical protein